MEKHGNTVIKYTTPVTKANLLTGKINNAH